MEIVLVPSMKRESVMYVGNLMAESRLDPVHFFHKGEMRGGILFIEKTC
jgi:hypothetical protein